MPYPPPAHPRQNRRRTAVGSVDHKTSMVDDYKPYLHQRWEERGTQRHPAAERDHRAGLPGKLRRSERLSAPDAPPGPGHHRPAIGPQSHRLDHHPPRPARRTTATPAQSGPEPVPRAGHARHTRPCLRRHPHPAPRPEPPAWISAVRADDLPSLHGFAGGNATWRPSPPASPSHGTLVRSKATSTASRCSNARCSAEPACHSCASESFSATNHSYSQSWLHGL
jgi:hypothetical protein